MKTDKVPDKIIMGFTGHKSLEVFNQYYKPNDIEKVDLNDKNQLVLDYVKEMEFQHDEVLSLIIMLTTSLAEKEYNF